MINNKQTLEPIKIQKTVYNAYGLAYHDNHTIFVQNALPEDILAVTPLYSKKNSIFCEIYEILQPSPLRGPTRCPLTTTCGACDWVNIPYENQLSLKSAIYNEIYNGIIPLSLGKGGLLAMPPEGVRVVSRSTHKNVEIPFEKSDIISPSPSIDHYRNKCFFPVQAQNNEIKIGMFARNSHQIIHHDHCYLYPPIYKQITNHIKDWITNTNSQPYNETDHSGNIRHIGIRSSQNLAQILIIIVTKENTLPKKDSLIKSLTSTFPKITGIIQNIQPRPNNTITSDHSLTLYGHDYLEDTLNNITLRIHHNAFFQINSAQAQIIYNDILTHLDPQDIVLDAYSGIGTIAFCIHHKVKKVICIESSPAGHTANLQNQKLLHTKNITAINQKTETILTKTLIDHKINTIIFDPPRKGLDKSIISTLATHKIPKIIYLSCDPTTQKRDLLTLQDIGYKITTLQAYDMFPHTYHIESLAILS